MAFDEYDAEFCKTSPGYMFQKTPLNIFELQHYRHLLLELKMQRLETAIRDTVETVVGIFPHRIL
jgi:hypothetical protein